MDDERWDRVDAYFSDLFGTSDDALAAALETQRAAGLPAINVAPNQGKFLMLLVQIAGARRVLEIGTLGGYSTIWLARGAGPKGRVVTLEFDPAHAAVARTNLARAGFTGVDVRVGDALETLPALAAESSEPFDFIFLDANKDGYPAYLAWSLRLSRPGTVIVADNVVRGGRVLDAATTEASVAGVRRFSELVAAEPRLRATVVQTVGSKGYDGFAIALVTA